MPPKSKKAVEKEKNKTIEDKTFGLKNKNKSKKVQQYVSQVKKQAEYKAQGSKSNREKQLEDNAKKTSKKALMASRMAELDMIMKPVKEKGLSEAQLKQEEAKRKAEEEEAERLRILSLPVEEQIEIERAKLTTRTAVTLELFLEWRQKKREERAARERKEKEERMKNLSKAERSRGQGMSGKELFDFNKSVFVDDEAADETHYEVPEDYRSDEEPADEQGSGPNAASSHPAEDPDPPERQLENLDVKDEATDVGDESLFS